jgi:hypothetical protein
MPQPKVTPNEEPVQSNPSYTVQSQPQAREQTQSEIKTLLS